MSEKDRKKVNLQKLPPDIRAFVLHVRRKHKNEATGAGGAYPYCEECQRMINDIMQVRIVKPTEPSPNT